MVSCVVEIGKGRERGIEEMFKKKGGKVLREEGRERWRVVEIHEEGGRWKTERRFNRAGKSDKP